MGDNRMTEKKSGRLGNQNAAKPENLKASAQIQIRVNKHDKENKYKILAEERGESLSKTVIALLDKECERLGIK